MADLKVSEQVKAAMQAHNIGMPELVSMVQAAANITHGLGNRRYHNWLFRVPSRGFVETLYPWVREEVRLSTKNFVMHEDCLGCDGGGCARCDFVGYVRVIYKRSVNNGKANWYKRDSGNPKTARWGK